VSFIFEDLGSCICLLILQPFRKRSRSRSRGRRRSSSRSRHRRKRSRSFGRSPSRSESTSPPRGRRQRSRSRTPPRSHLRSPPAHFSRGPGYSTVPEQRFRQASQAQQSQHPAGDWDAPRVGLGAGGGGSGGHEGFVQAAQSNPLLHSSGDVFDTYRRNRSYTYNRDSGRRSEPPVCFKCHQVMKTVNYELESEDMLTILCTRLARSPRSGLQLSCSTILIVIDHHSFRHGH
jgi:hypothetical protein